VNILGERPWSGKRLTAGEKTQLWFKKLYFPLVIRLLECIDAGLQAYNKIEANRVFIKERVDDPKNTHCIKRHWNCQEEK